MKTGPVASSSSWKTSRRWTTAEKQAVLDALRRSGEAVTRFAARHGIAAHRLYDARRRYAEPATDATADAAPAGTPLFVEIMPTARGASIVFEVMLPGGEVVRVPSEFDDASLRRLLAAVRGSPAC